MQIDLNEAGLAYLNSYLEDECIFVLVSSRDINSDTPTGDESVICENMSPGTGDKRPVIGLQYDTAWNELDTWDNTLTVTSAGSFAELDTWDNTLTVGEETPTPHEPLVDYDTLITKILMPFILLFLIAFVLGQEFGAVGFIVGAMIGLFLVWMITGVSFGLVLLGLFVLGAIWWRM
ncbi:MAG: hypothetical protein EOM68_31825 [Spirochaetia bacterium]|nr:hypothetical protein [Spirochaetia bacterium]